MYFSTTENKYKSRNPVCISMKSHWLFWSYFYMAKGICPLDFTQSWTWKQFDTLTPPANLGRLSAMFIGVYKFLTDFSHKHMCEVTLISDMIPGLQFSCTKLTPVHLFSSENPFNEDLYTPLFNPSEYNMKFGALTKVGEPCAICVSESPLCNVTLSTNSWTTWCHSQSLSQFTAEWGNFTAVCTRWLHA